MKRSPAFSSPLPSWCAGSFPVWFARLLYERVIAHRNHLFDSGRRQVNRPSGIPVISIGGIRAGGSGKTPATLYLIEKFIHQGYDVAVLSRGYGRKSRESRVVSPGAKVSWAEIGDEPAMMRRQFPDIWMGIGADRTANARILAPQMGPKAVMLMDDGFQHRMLHRDLDIVCLHDTLFEDRMLPQGYLREPVRGLSRAQVHFCIASQGATASMKRVIPRLKAMFPNSCQLLMESTFTSWVNAVTGEERNSLPFSRPVALCGIARPERFFDLCIQQGVKFQQKMSFPDHYIFRESDFIALRKLYSQGFVTTEKDVVRLAAVKDLPLEQVWYAKMRLERAEKESSIDFSHYIKGI